MFDSIGKTKEFYKEVWVDGNFPPKCSTNGSYGKIPKDANPTNQTSIIGKIPKGLNPPKILCNSFESKEPSIFGRRSI